MTEATPKPKQSRARRDRGYATQRIVSEWFASQGWEYAEPVGAGRPGSDVTGMPGLDVEVKATSRFSPLAWLRQMEERRGPNAAIAFGVWRPDGYGPKHVEQWPVIVDLSTFTLLLRQAGYGDGPGGDDG